MICRNCGFQNAPGDAFCGSCGQFLEWTGEESAAAQTDQPTEETAIQSPPTGLQGRAQPLPDEAADSNFHRQQPDAQRPINRAARHSARPQRPDSAPRMAAPGASGVSYGAVTCWNCGRRNSASRSFCQQCGERLTLPAGGAQEAPSSVDRAKVLAIGLGVVALLLLAGGAAALFLGGTGPAATPTPTGAAVVTDPPATGPASPPPTIGPTAPPSETPTEPPTQAPTGAPATPPPPTAVSCADSTVPTRWVNLSGRNTSERVRRDEMWCIHQVIIVPDPNFGNGTIRLRASDGVLAQVTHNASSSQTEYPFTFTPAELVAGRQDVLYRMNCAGDFCNAVIQIGFEPLRQDP